VHFVDTYNGSGDDSSSDDYDDEDDIDSDEDQYSNLYPDRYRVKDTKKSKTGKFYVSVLRSAPINFIQNRKLNWLLFSIFRK
jgi:hypothetical protein